MGYLAVAILGGLVLIGFVSAGFLKVYAGIKSPRLRMLAAVASAYALAIVLGGFGMADGSGWAGEHAALEYAIPAIIVLAIGLFFFGRPRRNEPPAA